MCLYVRVRECLCVKRDRKLCLCMLVWVQKNEKEKSAGVSARVSGRNRQKECVRVHECEMDSVCVSAPIRKREKEYVRVCSANLHKKTELSM